MADSRRNSRRPVTSGARPRTYKPGKDAHSLRKDFYQSLKSARVAYVARVVLTGQALNDVSETCHGHRERKLPTCATSYPYARGYRANPAGHGIARLHVSSRSDDGSSSPCGWQRQRKVQANPCSQT